MLKTLLSACAMAQSLMGPDEMALGLGEAVQAYNMDVGDSGFSPMQAAVGRHHFLLAMHWLKAAWVKSRQWANQRLLAW